MPLRPSLNSLPPPGAYKIDLCVCAGAQLVGVTFPLDVLSGATPLTSARLTKSSPNALVVTRSCVYMVASQIAPGSDSPPRVCDWW